MTTTTPLPPLTYRDETLDDVRLMTDSSPLLGDIGAIRQRMSEAGYLYFPGFLGRERVIEARRQIVDRLEKAGALAPGTDPMDAIPHPTNHAGFEGGRLDALFENPDPIDEVLYRGPMMQFFREFLAADVRHYDFTWMRQVPPGPATPIHSDVVYMGRGTHQLFTAWTPMGDNSFDMGGLLILEGSHRDPGLAKRYWKFDVDAFCSNHEDKRDAKTKGTGGWLRGTAKQIRHAVGGRWVTGDFRMGDVVIFSVYTVHGGTDNHSNVLRLSTDTRYQRVSEAADERWVGEKPPAHGPLAKRGMIC